MSKFSIIIIPLILTLSLFLHASFCTIIGDRYLEAHNRLRSAANVPPLRWNQTAVMAARTLVEWQMKQAYGGPKLNSNMSKPYGMNMYAMCTTRDLHSPEEDVGFWEKGKLMMYDNSSSNNVTIRSSCMTDIDGLCSSYRQMVWKETAELGCHRVRPSEEYCENSTGLGTFTVCLYYPPAPAAGNV